MARLQPDDGNWWLEEKRTKRLPHVVLQDGKLVSDPSPGNAGSHGARLPFQVTTREPQHPIMEGLRLSGCMPPMNSTPRFVALEKHDGTSHRHSDPKNKGTDHDEPMLIVVKYGKGRVFHTPWDTTQPP